MFNAIGAHIYAGGFTVGVSKYFNVLAHLEHAAYGKDVVALNFPGLPVYDGGPAKWPTKWPRGADRPRFLYANPPCAIWSTASAGRSTLWRDDPRLRAHHDIFGYGLDLGVDVMAIESVTAAFTKGRDHVDELTKKAAERGYSTTIVSHDAQHLGVAQIRKRVFLVFYKVVISWELPNFKHQTTVRDALKGVRGKTRGADPSLSPRQALLVAETPQGGKLRETYARLFPNPSLNPRGGRVGAPSFLELRASWDAPAPVVIAGKMSHPEEVRFMSQEELAAICSFPQTYKWPSCSLYDISGYMSRGVMPRVGEWLAENVARAIEGGKRLNRPTAEVLDITKPPGRTYPLVAYQQHQEEPEDMPKTSVAVPRGAPSRSPTIPPANPGEGSGAYMRRLMGLGIEDSETILAGVHAGFPGSKATKSDVAYNRAIFRKQGAPAAAPSAPAKPPKYAPPAPTAHQPDLPFEGGKRVAAAPGRASNAMVDAVARMAGASEGETQKIRALADRLGSGPGSVKVTVGGETFEGIWLRGLFR
jgi:site-specific DNA-cytosine methylase